MGAGGPRKALAQPLGVGGPSWGRTVFGLPWVGLGSWAHPCRPGFLLKSGQMRPVRSKGPLRI